MPYPNEHSARLKAPGSFSAKAFRRTKGGTIYGKLKVPATIGIIWGKLKGKDKPNDPPIPQALRFSKSAWTTTSSKKWLKDKNITYIKFEPASKTEKAEETSGLRFDGVMLSISDGQLAIVPIDKEE